MASVRHDGSEHGSAATLLVAQALISGDHVAGEEQHEDAVPCSPSGSIGPHQIFHIKLEMIVRGLIKCRTAQTLTSGLDTGADKVLSRLLRLPYFNHAKITLVRSDRTQNQPLGRVPASLRDEAMVQLHRNTRQLLRDGVRHDRPPLLDLITSDIL